MTLKSDAKFKEMTLKSDAKFKEKLTCAFTYDMRNFVNFHPATQKSKNFTLIDYFYPKYMRFERSERSERSEKLYIDGLFLSKE